MTHNLQGKRIASENLAGQVTTTAWDCCFAYANNTRSELTNAVASVDSDYRYDYAFDDIGNRLTSSELGTNSVYTANQLNQYTEISDSALSASPRETFTPLFDDDGNQTLIQTSTGIWSVTYNGENRPILWTLVNSSTPNSSTPPLISMSYDRMGRRVTKNEQRFVYNGYLQIANFEKSVTNSQHTTHNLQLFIWDPTEPVATRPIVWNRNGSLSFYIHDGNKNVSEGVFENGDVIAHYEYAPFGAVTDQHGTFAVSNPWRFSCEYDDGDNSAVYYNYRHFEPMIGRWMSRDSLSNANYTFVDNNAIVTCDLIGFIGINPLGIVPPFWDTEVDGFAEMFIYAMLRARSYTLSKEGKAHLKIVEELKINIEREALTRIDCSASEFAPLRKEISGNYHFGGSLFSNIFSSNWGPLTYNFYTVGNVSVTKGSSYSISGRKVDDVDCPCCCFELSFSVELDFTDKFDFVPDRSWLNWSGIRYNLLALPFSYVYNGVFGASCPEVTAHINEQWEKKLCGLEK